MSQAFLDLRTRYKEEISGEYFRLHRVTEDNRSTEISAIGAIQKLWRGYVARKYVAFLHSQATDIERVWRGYCGREWAKETQRQRITDAEARFFDAMATLIQKVWRGHRSRQMNQDFYARKNYVMNVTKRSQQLQQNIAKQLDQQRALEEEQMEMKKTEEFTQITENLHHLLGTTHIRGVFSSPYGESFSTSAFGRPMEDHIKESFEQRRRTQKTEAKKSRSQKRVNQRSQGSVGRPKARGKGRAMGMPTPPTVSSDQPDFRQTHMRTQVAYRQQQRAQ